MRISPSKAHFLSDMNKWFETTAHACLRDVFNIRFLGSKETKHAHSAQDYQGQGVLLAFFFYYCTIAALFYLFWAVRYHFEINY